MKPPSQSLPGHWLSCIFQLQCHINRGRKAERDGVNDTSYHLYPKLTEPEGRWENRPQLCNKGSKADQVKQIPDRGGMEFLRLPYRGSSALCAGWSTTPRGQSQPFFPTATPRGQSQPSFPTGRPSVPLPSPVLKSFAE